MSDTSGAISFATENGVSFAGEAGRVASFTGESSRVSPFTGDAARSSFAGGLGTDALTAAALDSGASPLAPARAERSDMLGLAAAGGSLLAEVVAISTASSALPACADADEMLRVAAELARDVIGLTRVAFYMRDPSAERLIFRGTWGTDAAGVTRAEHRSFHELPLQEALSLQNLRESGQTALCRPRATWFGAAVSESTASGPRATDAGAEGGTVESIFPESHVSERDFEDSEELGESLASAALESDADPLSEPGEPSSAEADIDADGWVMITPLFAAGHLVGVMYNDAARSQGGEPGKQAAAAVLCGMVAIDYIARRGPVRFQPLGVAAAPSLLVQRIRDAIDENPARRGKDLAVEFGVSPGHLARAFKREMGLSLVDYRNRKRIDRFWDALRRRGRAYSLKQAAFDAGFGSYAQFNRIHKKLVGVGPRLGARRTEAAAYDAREAAEASRADVA